jgi:hypothetical protein
MISLFIKYFPYILIFYFIIRSIKEPVFLIGIPFLLFFKQSLFFDKVRFLRFQGMLINLDKIFLVWLIIVWLIFFSRSLIQIDFKLKRWNKIKRPNWLDWLIIGLIIITCIDFVVVLNSSVIDEGVNDEFITLMALFIGFFIFKNIFSHIEIISLKKFLYSVVIINSIASLLYFIHHGLHVDLYDYPEYMEEFMHGENLTRNLWTMPVLWFFSISYLIINLKEKPWFYITLLIINFLGIFLSYTRSFLVIGIFVIAMYYFFNVIKRGNFISLIKYGIIIITAGFIFFFGMSKIVPASTKFFLDRFTELKENPRDEKSNDMIFRFRQTGEVINSMNDNKKTFGYGPVTSVQEPKVDFMEEVTADMVWTEVVFRWGFAGLGLFILLYIVSLILSFRLFINNNGLISKLGLLFFLTILATILEGFVMWTFLCPGRLAMGFWYFGVLSALTGFGEGRSQQFNRSENQYATLS